jgi:hypothetical protein
MSWNIDGLVPLVFFARQIQTSPFFPLIDTVSETSPRNRMSTPFHLPNLCPGSKLLSCLWSEQHSLQSLKVANSKLET